METVDGSYKALLNCAEEVATCEEVGKILDEATIAAVDIRIDAEKIDFGVRKLRAEVRPHEVWAEADSHDIEVAMKAQQEWTKELRYLQERVWAMRRNTECFGIDKAELKRCEGKVKAIRNEVEDVIDIVRHEDVTRALYSLNTSS